MMNKYQFHIAFNDKPNTAASKAVQDCKSILSECGYIDCSIEDISFKDSFYQYRLLLRILSILIKIKPGSLVAVQYPLLSGNRWFKYLIRAARLKSVNFWALVHDLDDLRYTKVGQGNDVTNLNDYECIVVHSHSMNNWLSKQGLSTQQVVLGAFDYLAVVNQHNKNINSNGLTKTIAFAGNLSKSNFLYALDLVKDWQFNLYGPNYKPEKANGISNICWHGSLSADQVLLVLDGSFGLIWDGDYIDRLDTDYGNYLHYNYPHKMSLYLAAGLPVIAPLESAVSSFIKEHQIGILIKDLIELRDFEPDQAAYQQMKNNVAALSEDLKTGRFLHKAIASVESKFVNSELNIKALITD